MHGCHTQFDFGVLREQNILPLYVPVDHMMGVEMGKTLEKKHEHTPGRSQMTDTHYDWKQTSFKTGAALCAFTLSFFFFFSYPK